MVLLDCVEVYPHSPPFDRFLHLHLFACFLILYSASHGFPPLPQQGLFCLVAQVFLAYSLSLSPSASPPPSFQRVNRFFCVVPSLALSSFSTSPFRLSQVKESKEQKLCPTMTTAVPRTDAASGAAAAAGGAASTSYRYFDLLELEGQERVTLLKTKFNLLLPLERAAFLQDLGLQSISNGDASHIGGPATKAVGSHSDRLRRVQERQPGYVALQEDYPLTPGAMVNPFQSSSSSTSCPPDGAAAAAEGALVARTSTSEGTAGPDTLFRQLLSAPGLFGETEVPVRVPRASLYERVAQARSSGSNTTGTAVGSVASGAEATEGGQPQPVPSPLPLQGESGEASGQPQAHADVTQRGEDGVAGVSSAPPAVPAGDEVSAPSRRVYRSNAYQALRLAHSFPGPINGTTVESSPRASATASANRGDANAVHTLNVSGLPLYEEEMREWFDVLDTDQTGLLSVQEFARCMDELQRDFGVRETFVKLTQDGERLAKEEKLNFEAFAFLVLRLLRL